MPARSSSTPMQLRRPMPIEAVVIGASTGGPNALVHVLSAIPADLPVPIIIVQHMPPDFTRHMAERLAARTKLNVREAVNDVALGDAQVWIAPGDYHLVICRQRGELRLHTNQDQPENSCRPSVDVLFRSAAAALGPAVLAVVLTGMGQDGLLGAQCIRNGGAEILVQNQETSVVWGMPGTIARAGLADEILPLDSIAFELTRRVQRSYGLSTSGIFRAPPSETSERPASSTRASSGSTADASASGRRFRAVDPGRADDEKKEQPARPGTSRSSGSSARLPVAKDDLSSARFRFKRHSPGVDSHDATPGSEPAGPEPTE